MKTDETIHFQLFDEQGRLVLEDKVSRAITTVDVSDRPNGVYFLNINRNGRVSKWQIVKIG